MIRLLGLMGLCLLCSPAMAQVSEIPPECRILPEHKAADGVNYQPGVDVHGNAVVPADVNGSPLADQQTLVVPLTVDLASRLQGMNVQGLNMDSTLGFLEITPQGRVTYNGQDLTSQVYVLCGEKPAENNPLPATEPDRQKAPDIIQSAPVKETISQPAKPNPAPAKPAAPPRIEEPVGELLQGGEYSE